MARAAAARRVSLAHLMAAPSAHLRLVWGQPARPADEPYDQLKDRAL